MFNTVLGCPLLAFWRCGPFCRSAACGSSYAGRHPGGRSRESPSGVAARRPTSTARKREVRGLPGIGIRLHAMLLLCGGIARQCRLMNETPDKSEAPAPDAAGAAPAEGTVPNAAAESSEVAGAAYE